MKQLPSVLLVPTMYCPGNCSYCFGPYQKSAIMDEEIVSATADWILQLYREFPAREAPPQDKPSPKDTRKPQVSIIFHGGEPLAAGLKFYEMALPLLKEKLHDFDLRLSMLSNLWLLDETYVDLFKSYGVGIGTSLDGPEEINDKQRGEGYFARAMAGLNKLRKAGIPTMCMCTFSRESAKKAGEIFDFFHSEGLNFDFKTVIGSFECRHEKFVIPPDECVDLIQILMDRYLASDGKIKVRTLHGLLRTIVTRSGPILETGDCLGKQLAIGPEGEIFNCQRFAGKKDFVWARVKEMPSLDRLFSSNWSGVYTDRMHKLEGECRGCSYFDICRGGCAYNHFSPGKNESGRTVKDPYCETYKAILDYITKIINQQMNDEAFSGVRNKRGKLMQAILNNRI